MRILRAWVSDQLESGLADARSDCGLLRKEMDSMQDSVLECSLLKKEKPIHISNVALADEQPADAEAE